MLDRTQQPPVHDFEGFAPLPPRRLQLANGIVLIFFEDTCLDLIHLSVRVNAGSLYESQKRVAAFTYELLKESHPAMNASELDDFFDFYGATINPVCSLGYASLNVQVPKKNLGMVVPVVAELFASPCFRAENMERYRSKSILDFEYYVQKTDYRASQLAFNAYLGKDFPCGKMLERSDLEAVTMEQVRDYHQATCCAENIRLFVAGNLNDDELSLVSAAFAQLPAGKKSPELPDAGRHFTPRRIAERRGNAKQTSLVLCRPTLHYLDPDALRNSFLITLFCNYFGSRLMQNLRETNGCTYGVSSSVFYYRSGTFFSIESEVNNNKVELALTECFREMDRICNEPVDADELNLVKNYLTGSELRNVDGRVALMQAYTKWDDFGCDHRRFGEFMQAIKEITAADVQNLAQRLLRPDMFTVITVGNY